MRKTSLKIRLNIIDSKSPESCPVPVVCLCTESMCFKV